MRVFCSKKKFRGQPQTQINSLEIFSKYQNLISEILGFLLEQNKNGFQSKKIMNYKKIFLYEALFEFKIFNSSLFILSLIKNI